MARPKIDESKKHIRKDITMEPDQYEKLVAHCEREERSVSWVIRKALEEYLTA